MSRIRRHKERHVVARIGWLRAAVLGANDGIISTASLILGVASAAALQSEILIAGVAGLVAGAMSMAAGEYVSVSSQSDTERADLDRERRELADDPEFEKQELTELYIARGLEAGLAREVAEQLMAKDALGVHARDELGISEISSARPVQAALHRLRRLALEPRHRFSWCWYLHLAGCFLSFRRDHSSFWRCSG
jgi:VIT1/CCC1 family predicted Fe2+/Mn2+ transporter